MEFHDLEVLLAVSQEKSFSRAAKKVFRTQPAVSLAVRRLEEELGGPVFDRSTKEPILTDLGKVVLGYATQLLNLRNQIIPAVEELQNLNRGKVTIGANETGAIFLLDHIIEFRQRFPNIKVEVVRSRSRDIPKSILQRNLDLGIISYDPEEPNLETSVVYHDHLSLVVYPSHKFAKRKSVGFKELADESFAAHYVDTKFRAKIISIFKSAGVSLNIGVELPTIESIKKYVEQEQAIAFIPRMCIESEIARGELMTVKVPEMEVLERKLRVAHLRGEGRSNASKVFVEELLSYKE